MFLITALVYSRNLTIHIHTESAVSDSQRYPLNLFRIKYEFFYEKKMLTFNWDFPAKVTAGFMLQRQKKLVKIKTF